MTQHETKVVFGSIAQSSELWPVAGIYIHVPFCRRRCHYCDFYFSTDLRWQESFVDALLQEILVAKERWIWGSPATLYFGGGTPSLLAPSLLQRILQAIDSIFGLSSVKEITMEVNPDDVSEESAKRWKAMGVNRVSLGVQSFHHHDLAWMGRMHSAAQAKQSLDILVKAGFAHISLDLIYGSPGQTQAMWQQNLDLVEEWPINHLSAYALTVEPNTPLERLQRRGQKEPVVDDDMAEAFALLVQWAHREQWVHYEVSNLSKPGAEAVHNSAYWHGEPYFGFGPSAHSFDGINRWRNIADLKTYCARRGKDVEVERETLTTANRLNEWLMTQLRLRTGIPWDALAESFGDDISRRIKQSWSVQSVRWQEKVTETSQGIKLEGVNRLWTDRLASDLMVDDHDLRL